jgi:probable blue pigment (indigoidine) exporter
MPRNVILGLVFTILWATGSVAAKFGILSADALILASVRFIATGFIFGPYYLLHKKYRFFPDKHDFKVILIYGLLNTTLTLGSFFAAQKYASSGISMLFIAVAPLFMALFSALFLKRKLSRYEIAGMITAFTGLIISAASALPSGHVKPIGIVLLIIYILAYALSSVYFSSKHISISVPVFNVWQVFIGGLLLLPFSLLFHSDQIRHIDLNLILTLLWMIVILSFIANQLWLHLVKTDAVKAAAWLYLTPIFGYIYGYVLLKEDITFYSVIGGVIVIIGLVIAGRKTAQPLISDK